MRKLVKILLFTTLVVLAQQISNADDLSSLDSDGYIRDWLVSGPYPSYQVDGKGQAYNTDFLQEEAQFVPYPGMKAQAEFIADWGKLVAGVGSTNEWGFQKTKSFDTSWRKKSSSGFKVVFDNEFDPIYDFFCVYSVCWIESPDRRKVIFGAGSDDDHKIYLNGKLIGKHYGTQVTIKDYKIYNAELSPGLNRLMFKLVDRIGSADFCLRIVDSKKKGMNDLKFYTDHPGRKYNAELFNNGYAANMVFEEKHLFAGLQKLRISVFSDIKNKYSLRLNGKDLSSDITSVDLKDGKNLLDLEVIVNGKVAARLQKEATAYSKETLEAENKAIELEIKKNSEIISTLPTQINDLEKQIITLEKERKNAYAGLERKYTEQHSDACREAKKSIDEPMESATVRSRLCINGEWDASTDRKNCSPFVLPAKMYNEYFRTYIF